MSCISTIDENKLDQLVLVARRVQSKGGRCGEVSSQILQIRLPKGLASYKHLSGNNHGFNTLQMSVWGVLTKPIISYAPLGLLLQKNPEHG